MIRLVSICLSLLSFDSLANMDWRGHHRLIGQTSYGAIEGYENSPFYSQLVLNNRLMGVLTKDTHTFEIAYELFSSYNRYEIPLLPSDLEVQRFNYRVSDFDYYLVQHELLKPNSYSIIHNLDRLFYQYSHDKYDIKIGRQVVAFGSARAVNPLDVLVPFDLVMVNLEQRPGVDAVRGRYSFSEMGVVEIGTVLEEKIQGLDQFRFISVGDTFFAESTDIKLLYASLKQIQIRVLDLQASIGGWGTWFEYAFYTARDNSEFKRYSAGGQYHFSNDIDIFIEYHYNEAGAEKSDEYLIVRNKDYISSLAMYLFGQDYLNWGGSYMLTPLKTFSLNIMNNLNDGSKLVSPSFDYNFANDWFMQIGGFWGFGDKAIDGTTEFAQYPRSLFVTVKNFF